MMKTQEPDRESEPSHEKIALLAYEIWEDKRAQYAEQSPLDDWLEAESVLRGGKAKAAPDH